MPPLYDGYSPVMVTPSFPCFPTQTYPAVIDFGVFCFFFAGQTVEKFGFHFIFLCFTQRLFLLSANNYTLIGYGCQVPEYVEPLQLPEILLLEGKQNFTYNHAGEKRNPTYDSSNRE
jgi:hypothetical protein